MGTRYDDESFSCVYTAALRHQKEQQPAAAAGNVHHTTEKATARSSSCAELKRQRNELRMRLHFAAAEK